MHCQYGPLPTNIPLNCNMFSVKFLSIKSHCTIPCILCENDSLLSSYVTIDHQKEDNKSLTLFDLSLKFNAKHNSSRGFLIPCMKDISMTQEPWDVRGTGRGEMDGCTSSSHQNLNTINLHAESVKPSQAKSRQVKPGQAKPSEASLGVHYIYIIHIYPPENLHAFIVVLCV